MASSTNPEHADENQPLLRQTSPKLENASSTLYLKLTVMAIGAFIANLDNLFVVATYNSISSEFGQASAGPWILIAYNLGFSVALPMYGALGDRYGIASPLMVAYASFGAGCAWSGLAPNVWNVVLGRALSGTGGGGMAAMVQYTVTASVPPEQVAMYSSYIYVIQNVGRSLGGPIGGILTDVVGWRWSFLGQSPIIATCMLCISWLFFSTRKQESLSTNGEETAEAEVSRIKRTIDFAGIAAFTVRLTSFLLAITISDNTSHLAPKSYAVALLAVSFVAAIALFFIERDYAETPLIPLELLKGILGVQMIVQCIIVFAYAAIISNAATYFVRTENASNAIAALHLVPFAIGHTIGTLFAGRVIHVTKKYKSLASAGLLSSTLGYTLMAIRWQGPVSVPESFYVTFFSVGLGVVCATQLTALNLRSPKQRGASAVSLYLLCQQMGYILGVSGSAVLIDTIFRNVLSGNLGSMPQKDEIVQNILDNTRYAFTLPESMQTVVIRSYTTGFRAVCALSGALSILLHVIIALMREQPMT